MTSPNNSCWILGLNTFLGPLGPPVSPVLFHIAPAGVPPALCPDTQWCFRKRTHFHVSWLPGSQVNQTLKTRNHLGTSRPPILTASSQKDFCSSSCNISVSFNIFELFPGRHCQPWEDISRVSLHVNWVTPEREFLFPARRTENESQKKKTKHDVPHSLSSVDIYVPVREGEALRGKTTHEVRLSRNFIPFNLTNICCCLCTEPCKGPAGTTLILDFQIPFNLI